MKFKNPLLVVSDMEKSVAFYQKVLGLHVVMDFGANKTLTGGLCLQTLESYRGFLGTDQIFFGGNNFEIYFEEDDMISFSNKLEAYGVELLHPVKEHAWGQRVIRFYDPDRHIIEVGETMKSVCERFRDRGMTLEQIAVRMDVPMKFVNACLQ